MRLCYLFIAFVLMGQATQAQEDREWTATEKFFIKINKAMAKKVTGLYSNREQADTATSKLYASQDIRSFAIWTDEWAGKKPDVWYYFGWFATGIPDNPLSEYIAHMHPVTKDSFVVDWYSIPHPEKYKREWERLEPYKALDSEKLLERPAVCRCYLVQDGAKQAEMRSLVPCPVTNNSGGKFRYIYFDIILKSNVNIAKNKYFDKDFNVVFEFKNPSEFKLISRNPTKFTEE